MKQQILNLKKKILLVELPEGYVVVSVFPPKRTLTMWNENGQYITEKLDFDVDEIGKLTDIAEGQFAEFSECINRQKDEYRYRNYNIEYGVKDNWWSDSFKTAKESFFSYLESQKILFEDKLGEFPTKQNTGLEYGMEYISKVQRWEEEQEKVRVLSNCYLFQILN